MSVLTVNKRQISMCLRLLVLLSLLLIVSGDVELNPGPAGTRGQSVQAQKLSVSESGELGLKAPDKDNSEIIRMLKDIKADLNNKFETLNNKVDNMAADFHVQLEKVMQENDQLKASITRMAEQFEDMECRNRRDNLIFHGISGDAGETWEKSEERIRTMLVDDLEMESGVTIIRAHRLNPRRKDSPIIAKFLLSKDKSEIYVRSRKRLSKESKLRVTEDFPAAIREDRRALSPLFGEALEDGKKPKMRVNKLFIGRDVYMFDRTRKVTVKVSSTQDRRVWSQDSDRSTDIVSTVRSDGPRSPNYSTVAASGSRSGLFTTRSDQGEATPTEERY